MIIVAHQLVYPLYPIMHWTESYLRFSAILSSHSAAVLKCGRVTTMTCSTCTVTRFWSSSCFFLILCYFKSIITGGMWERHLPCLIVKLCSLSPGFWQSFISIEVCRDCIPALASSCKKQLMGFFVCLLFFLKVKRIS